MKATILRPSRARQSERRTAAGERADYAKQHWFHADLARLFIAWVQREYWEAAEKYFLKARARVGWSCHSFERSPWSLIDLEELTEE